MEVSVSAMVKSKPFNRGVKDKKEGKGFPSAYETWSRQQQQFYEIGRLCYAVAKGDEKMEGNYNQRSKYFRQLITQEWPTVYPQTEE